MPGREYTSQSVGGYRFGFNSQEQDDEIYGKGNASSAEFWEYDARLGRRWNIDPEVKIWESSYNCFSGNPILYCDPNGDDVKYNKVGDRFRIFFGRILNKDFRKEFKELKKSENLYIFKLEDNSKTNSKGQFDYKPYQGKDELVIGYSLTKSSLKDRAWGQGRWALIYHETKHAIQFEKGRVGFVKTVKGWEPDPFSIDQTDEVEAFDAQLLFRKRDYYKDPNTNRVENTVSFYYRELHKTGTTTYNGNVFTSKFGLINYITGNGYSWITNPNSAVNCHIKTRIRNSTEFAMPYRK